MSDRFRSDLNEAAVTPLSHFLGRRKFLLGALASPFLSREGFATVAPCSNLATSSISLLAAEQVTAFSEASSYNNYIEFTSDKRAVKHLARELTLNPWAITVDGEVEKSVTLDVDWLSRHAAQEERIYRFRCVEGWSMVVPWRGLPLCQLLAQARPTSRAKYVQFLSLLRPAEMVGQRSKSKDWPYTEALTIEEAMHPLTLAVTGMYGESLPPQNGGPFRIVVPWKYGFKSPKAVTHIRLLASRPSTTWSKIAPSEYGFYGNVNPEVPHPRWSQARETRLGELRKRPTLPFNGYAEHVFGIYRHLDPKLLY